MSDLPKISVLIPLYRGKGTIKACLESLIRQEGIELQILLLDNGCPEKSGEWAGYFLSGLENPPEWRLFEEKANIGFAAAMNRLYKSSDAPWICFLNQDVELKQDHLKILVSALRGFGDKKIGGVCGTLIRSSSGSNPAIIDTTGHEIFRDRIVRNRDAETALDRAGVPFEGGEVFGLSAACSVYSRDALEESREPEGPFDPDFFSYFEDIDLDYRIHRAGWGLAYVPEAVGIHAHAGSGARHETRIRLRAYGNRRRIMWKHESIGSLLPDVLPIMAQDIFAWFRALITDPTAWFIGPWIFLAGFGRIIERRKDLDRRFGLERMWIRKWLKTESERIINRKKK
ncbi:MAG: glycosyltransferase family 2 protein [bacterium]|nr:glycosyltransferase family 2 protein [bacterium]